MNWSDAVPLFDSKAEAYKFCLEQVDADPSVECWLYEGGDSPARRILSTGFDEYFARLTAMRRRRWWQFWK